MDFYQENQLTKEAELKKYKYQENESFDQVEKNQDRSSLKDNSKQNSEKNNIEKTIDDNSQSNLQMNNKSYQNGQQQNYVDFQEQQDISTHPYQPKTKFSELNKLQIPFYCHVNKMINYSIDEEEKQQEVDFQNGKYKEDTSSVTKNKLFLDSESTQPTQKLQIDQQQDQNIQYQKSFDEATFLKNQASQSYKQQKYEKAIEQYNLALGFCDPQFLIRCPQQLFGEYQKLRISVILHLSSCYLNIGNLKQCIYQMNIAIQLDPLNPKVWYKRAIAHQLQYNYEDAYKDIEEAWNLVKTTTQDPDIFNKRKEILNQIDSQCSQQSVYNGKLSKINQLESISLLSDLKKTNSITSNLIIGNRNMNFANIIFKITTSTILASWITKYLLKEKLLSKNGLIKALTIFFTTASYIMAVKKWQQYTLTTITLGILVIGLKRKRRV
ncbi:unnamed protein product [Paramecium pentaurelia]|uniref:Tetratricopeptide repeat protein n=1 Tax=Paramecium pentaurelia TaxID=43138 RepID=A0A8S1RZP4_9CILI|nr:unnamed protein product [Paramecium pentaurelia]